MKPHDVEQTDAKGRRVRNRIGLNRGFWVTTIILAVVALLAHAGGNRFLGNLTIFVYLFYLLNKFVLNRLIGAFQERFWPRVLNRYERFLNRILTGWRWSAAVLVGTIGMFVLSVFMFSTAGPKVVFFPEADPNFIYTYVELPIGTHQRYTDSVVRIVENRIIDKLGKDNPLVESVISNVTVGAGNQTDFEITDTPHKGKVSVGFVEFAARNGVSTKPYLNDIREAVKGIAGVTITVEQEQGGPPVGKPINIEISSDDLPQLIVTSQMLRRYLDSLNIEGVEELKSDLALNLPEIVVNIDRNRASREGISTGQIGGDIRKMVFGQDRPSKLRDDREEYPIQVRLKESQRSDLGSVLSQTIIYRDMATGGMLRQVPLSAFAEADYTSSYAGIRRKNNKRVVTISSNVLDKYNPMEVVAQVQQAAAGFKLPKDVTINYTGEQEEQMETVSFLGKSMLISILLIILILMIQFNSISRTVIILSEIIFSVTGVLLGFTLTGWDFSSIMGGIGIVALAGIVVRNGILLVEFADQRLSEGADLKTALVDAGKTRMTPVLMTAMSTILGLIPLAIGFNIDFYTLFADLNPHIFFGGDSVAFWGPLSWSIIFGLSFATLLTLVVVPAMMLLAGNLKQAFGLPVFKKKITVIDEDLVAVAE
jgi:multidrug efflux pump subunit AcrB